MASDQELHKNLDTQLPVAPLALLVMDSCRELGRKVNEHIVRFRNSDTIVVKDKTAYTDYYKDDYRMGVKIERFATGEAKATLTESARGKDIYILVDITNYTLTYSMGGFINHMSPDDHFADLKRVISAINGKARRITVIMPFLYEGRQHHRTGRESLDASQMLRELYDLGIDNFITFDAHDPRIQSVAPTSDFNNFPSPYQFLKALLKSTEDLIIDKDHVVVISPDEGALDRTIYFSSVIGADAGMFYKRRDFSRVVNGKNPIVAHEFLGTDLSGKDAIIIDDMISSGGSMLDTSRQLKENMHAKRVFICTTFGLFVEGIEAFDDAYAKGYFDKLVTTNLTYQPPELKQREWFAEADMSKYMANIIDFINHNATITDYSASTDKIHEILTKYNRNEQSELDRHVLDQTEF